MGSPLLEHRGTTTLQPRAQPGRPVELFEQLRGGYPEPLMSFFAVEPARWEALRARLPKPWKKDEVLIDLRWWQDQVLEGHLAWPGGRTLAKDWGWGHKRVRGLLPKVGVWSDPRKLDAWKALYPEPETEGHTEGTPRAQEGHTEGTPAEGSTCEIEEPRPGKGTPGAQAGHKKGHARDPFPHSHDLVSLSPREREEPEARDTGGLVCDPARLRQALADRHAPELAALLEHAQKRDPQHTFSPADIKALRPALDRWGRQQLELVWDYFQLASQTDYARDSGWASSWSAIANEKLPDRCRDATRWANRGRPAKSPASQRRGADRFALPAQESLPPEPEEKTLTPEEDERLYQQAMARSRKAMAERAMLDNVKTAGEAK